MKGGIAVKIFSTIIGGITKIAEYTASAIAAAIATPSVGTIATVVLIGIAIGGGGYLIYKGGKYLLQKADEYITNKCNPENAPTRINKLMSEGNSASTDAIANDIANRVCRSESHEKDDFRRYDLDDRIDKKGNRRMSSIEKDRVFRDDDDLRYRSSSRFDVDPLRAYDLIGHMPNNNGNCIDIYEPKRRRRRKKSKKANKQKMNEIRNKLDNLTIKPSGDEYLDNLPWLGGNITCIS
jgi:hypothetical protein